MNERVSPLVLPVAFPLNLQLIIVITVFKRTQRERSGTKYIVMFYLNQKTITQSTEVRDRYKVHTSEDKYKYIKTEGKNKIHNSEGKNKIPKSEDFFFYLKVLGSGKRQVLHWIQNLANIGCGHQCLRQENLRFNNN